MKNIRKITAALLLILMIATCFSFFVFADIEEGDIDIDFGDLPGEEEQILYGDANGDGKVSSTDIVRLKKYFAEYDPDTQTSTIEIFPGADANGDGKVSSTDIVRLKKYFAEYDPDTGVSSVALGPTNSN